MLKIVRSITEFNTEQLLRVYQQSVFEHASRRYPDLEKVHQTTRGESDFLSYLREEFFATKGAFYCVWVESDRYVSALRFEPYKDGLLLQAVETDPAERKRGYASFLLTEALNFLSRSDCPTVYSHIAKRNISSLGLHRKVGFQQLSDTATLADGTVSSHYCTMVYHLK